MIIFVWAFWELKHEILLIISQFLYECFLFVQLSFFNLWSEETISAVYQYNTGDEENTNLVNTWKNHQINSVTCKNISVFMWRSVLFVEDKTSDKLFFYLFIRLFKVHLNKGSLMVIKLLSVLFVYYMYLY